MANSKVYTLEIETPYIRSREGEDYLDQNLEAATEHVIEELASFISKVVDAEARSLEERNLIEFRIMKNLLARFESGIAGELLSQRLRDRMPKG